MSAPRETVECPDCGGEGSTFVDCWAPGPMGGHYTKHYPCTTCDATGEVKAPEPEGDDEEVAA